MPKSAPVLDTLPDDTNRARSGDVEVTCRYGGFIGGDPDDCTTHLHEHTGTVLVRLDHIVYNQHADSLIDAFAHEIVAAEDLGDEWTMTYTATGVLPNNVIVLTVSVTP